MHHRTLIGTIATLGFIALAGLFAALLFSLSSPSPAYAQTNSDPQFPASETGTRTVDENKKSYNPIGGPVTATDPNNDRLIYSLENARTSPFTIDTFSGQLQVGEPLDYETGSSYKVKVIATDPSGATASITVTIDVNNLEEPGRVSLSWRQPQVDTALEAILTDPDGGVTGVMWQWAKSSDGSNNWTNVGTNSPSYTPVAGDVGKYLRATASYTDGESSGTTRTAQAVSAANVRAEPQNNQAPVFNVNVSGGYSCDRWDGVTARVCLYVRRSAPAGSDIYYPARATDPDRDEVHYSLEGMDAASFNIVPSTGVLLTTKAHAYENKDQFEITITATDPSGQFDRITAALRPSGSSDAPAVNGPSDITYPENGTWPLATYSATASNPDHDIHGWIISVQPGGGDGDFFDIDDDGVLTFTQPPDYEDPADDNRDNTYSFSLHVYDTNPPNGRRPGQTFYNVSVTVVDVPGEVLEIRGPTAVDYAENGADAVHTYTVSNADGPVDWSLSGDDADKFSISNSGELTFNTPPDYENPTDADGKNDYLLSITVIETGDGGDQAKIEPVRVEVTDVNEPPAFVDETATRSVGENASPGAPIGEPVTATDPDDGDTLTYTLGGTDASSFDIDSYSGQLQTKAALDHETKDSYSVTVSVSDNENAEGNSDPSADDTITVTINVTDENEAPAFPTQTATRTVAENTAAGQPIGLPVEATDLDAGDSLTYSLDNVGAQSFGIVGTSGQLQTKAPLDHEAKGSYTVTVTATDGSGASATIDVTITVTNVDEPGTVTLSNNQPSARVEITATLADPDGGVTGTSWQWAKSSDGTTGWVNVGTNSPSYTPVDDDMGYYLRAMVSYTDGLGSNKSSQAVSDNAVQAGANRPPEFDATTTTREVPENTGANTNIGSPVTANDPDTGNTLTYSLEGTDAASFQIVSASGQIQTETGVTYDHETTPSYSVTVKATDTSSATDTIDVTITVTNLDEDGAVTLTDERPVVDTALTATLDDPDRASGTTWQWARADSASGTFTDIGGATTSSYTPSTGDVGKYLQATASYTDGHGTGKSAQAVSANPVQAPPEFSSVTAIRSVAENTAAGINIGAPVTATDADTLTYTLGEPDEASFDIEPESGQLRTKEPLDYETKKSYEVTVTATDPSSLTASITVTITITNVEEAGTVTLSPVQPQVGTPLTATLADPDGDPTSVYWQWARGDSATGPFTNVSGGALVTYTPVAADAGKYLRATASYDDEQGAGKRADGVSDEAVQAVSANPVQAPPEFSTDAATRSVAENTAAGESIGAPVTATDADTLTYTLGGTDKASFDIEPESGQLRTEAPLDYETKKSYEVTVTATDPSSLTASITVTITITNVEEEGEVTLSSLQPQVGTALTAKLADPDGTLERVSWQWAKGDTTAGTFTNVSSGADPASYTPVAADVGKYLRATASYDDEQGAGKRADGVSDEAVQAAPTEPNSAPAFSADTATRSVDENTAPKANIGSPVTATDADSDTLTYSLSGTDADSFDIVAGSGQLQTKDPLDYEAEKNSYTVVVTATDPSGAADTIEVTITVENVDEPGTVKLSSVQPQVGTALTAELTDPDGTTSNVTWQWTRGGTTNVGSSNSYTPVAADVGMHLHATANYTDPQGSGKDANAVSDNPVKTAQATNNAPVFSAATAARSVPENALTGANIGTPVTATDADSDDILTYSLGGDDAASFEIEPGTGQLQTEAPLDYETKKSYEVTVTATDPSTLTDSITVTIAVENVDEEGTVTLSPDQPQAGTELTATLTDPDGTTSNVTWQWARGEDTGPYTDVSSGETYTPVASDVGKYLRATASYTDGHGSGKTAEKVSTVVRAPQATNSAPAFSGTVATRSVAENTAGGENIGAPVTATDADNDDTLTYTLSGTDAGFFAIVASTGQLRTKASLDYETDSSYTVVVTATDPSSLTTSITVTITITNVEEAGTVTLLPLQPQVGTPLTATLADPDGDPTSVYWQWARADSATGPFTNVSGGALVTYTPVAADAGKYLRATASYDDGQGAGKDANAVSANPVKTAQATNSAPVFSADTATRSVAENTGAGADFGAPVTATDSDTLTYSLGGTDADSFSIVDTSGQLQTKEPLDYETKKSYEVTVTATDPSRAADSTEVTITVTNLDEEGEVTLSSLQPQVETALTAELTDPDGTLERVSWQWAKGDTTAGTFTNVSSGADPASYTPVAADVGKYLRATASYTDPQGSGKNASEVSTHAVQAAPTEPNSAPAFSADTATRSVAENTEAGIDFGTAVTATDADSDTLTYSLSGTDADSFDIVAGSGQLQTKGPLDYEAEKNSYTVVVTATDPSGAADTIEVTITVENVDEPGTVKLSSVQPQVGTALTAELTDPDGTTSNVTWQWTRGGTTNVGSSNSYTPVAADVGMHLHATANYTDPQGSGKDANAVSDNPVKTAQATNNAPVFSAATAARSVPENALTGANIGTPVTATDADSDDILTYSLGGDDAASFEIEPGTGQLQTEAPLDYETKKSYEVTVTATDPSTLTDSITVTIAVENVDEEGTVTLSPDQPQAGTELTATLTDPDGTTSNVTWQWARGEDTGPYTDVSSGETYTPVASDVGKYLRATASYTDGHGSGKTAEKVSTVVRAPQATNSAPAFSGTVATRSVAENTAGGENIGAPVTATDADNDDTLTYTLSGTDAGFFAIVAATGQLQTNMELDYEAKSSYTVIVSVRDGRDASGNTDTTADGTIAVTITVTNANDAPVVSGDTSVSYLENDVSTVATYTATDQDGTTSFTWTLSGDDEGDFSITGGVLTFDPVPNYEAAADADMDNVYLVTVEASDGTVKGTLDVTVTVTDVNEPPAFPTSETGARSIAENTAADQPIGNPVAATDPENDSLTYSLDTAGAAVFAIDTSTGQLKTEAALDKETKATYEVTVSVKDRQADTNADATIEVTITVTDANDPPAFAAGTVTRSIPENTPAGQPIGDPVAADDTDTSDSLTYTLEGTDKDSFHIVPGTGQIQTKSGMTYDYEGTKSSYSVTVKADDNNGGTATKQVTITVTDVNEPPVVTGSDSVNYAENRVDAVATYTATDPEGAKVYWSLSGTDSGAFSITGGVLTFDTPPDFEAPPDQVENNVYLLTVKASDGSNNDTLNVTITVTDVNELPAFLSTESGTRSIAENTGADHDIGALVTATDPDDGDNLTYTLGGTDAGDFAIEASTGQLQTKADLDYETKPSYSVIVSVSDGRDANGNTDTTTDATTPVTIVVTDVNEQPAFALRTATRTIDENTAPETNIGAPITATDPDNDYTLSYSLREADAESFRINASTGQLQTKGELDFEATPSYTVTVSVHDGKADDGSPNQATDDTINVTITVTDVEEPGTVTLSSVQPQVGIELTANLDDPDGDVSSTAWSWESSSDQTDWSPISGAEAAAYTPVGDDVGDHLRVTATYTDRRGAGKTAQAVSTNEVQAAPLTNDPPAFSAETADRTIPENTAADTDIGDPVTATDSDNDALTYALSGTDSASFDIVQGAGQLKTKAALDHETKDSYTVTVTATDPSGESDEITVTITVTDVNEAPEVTVTPTVYFAENDSGPIATYTATDPDDNPVTWSLLGADAEDFSISEGVLTFKSPPNYEDPADADTDNVYPVTVKASDGTNTVTLGVTVTVTNVDEAGTVTISPEQPRVGTALTATLTDPDGDVSGTTWQWARSSDGSNNWVDIGTDSPSYTPAVGDVGNYLRATASYADGQGSGKTTQAVSANAVEAAPVTNMAPDFPPQPATRTVPENTGAGQSIGEPVAANDQNAGDTLTYKLGGTDAKSFSIVAATGQLQTKAALDHETKNSYEVTVSVRDSKDAGGSADTATDNAIAVTITVTNVDEAGTVTLSPAQPQAGTALTATLDDPDGSISGETWKWERSPDKNLWTHISSVVSDTYTPAVGDVGNYLRATASYADGQGSGKTAQAVSANAVEAAPVTNMAPDFPPQPATRTVPENTGAGQSIGEPVAANDQNAGDTLTYTLGGTDAASFNIVTSSGQLQTKASLNFESKNSYTVTVTAADPSNTWDIITVTITVTDVNEAPAFAAETDTRTIAENTSAGQDIGAPVAATDPDTGATLTYILGGTNAGDFNIDASSGQLQTKAALDYETKSSYSVEVSVRDSKAADGTGDSAADDTITVTVTITNADEAETVILSSIQPQVDTPLTATLGDPDGGVSGETWVWARFVDPNSGWTDITGATSDSYTPVDDDLGKYLRVTVSYTDGHGSGKSAREVSDNPVRAAPVNNAAPAFSDTSTTRSVAENTVPGTDIGDPVAAVDPDVGDTLIYTLGGTDAASFDIIASSGQLQTKGALDYETKPSYSVEVSVRDSKAADGTGDSAADDTITVTVTITNADEAGTVILSSIQPQVDTPLTATLGDPDDVRSVTWRWERPSNKGSWDPITSATSASYTPVAADVGDHLRATASYTDGHGPGKSAQAVSDNEVRAAPVTNNPPTFSAETADRTIAENTAPDTNIGNPVTATDPDTGDRDKLTYKLGGTDAVSFDIIASSGQLQTKAALDHETKQTYTVTVTAADPSGESDTITVTITVTNVNEAPVIGFAASIDYAENRSDRIATYTATDPEQDAITWSLSGADSEDFFISGTGELTFNTPPDHEAPADADTNNRYEITVQASDGTKTGDLPLTITVTNVDEAPELTGEGQHRPMPRTARDRWPPTPPMTRRRARSPGLCRGTTGATWRLVSPENLPSNRRPTSRPRRMPIRTTCMR